jgi:hypothetical protein
VPWTKVADNAGVGFLNSVFRKGPPLKVLRRLAQGPVCWLAFAGLALLFSPRSSAPLAAQSLTDFHLQWAWSVGGSGIGFEGLEVVDLDGNGRGEILVAADPGEYGGYWYLLEHREGELVQTFSSLPRKDGLVGLASGREAGRTRIVAAGRSSLTVYDGATRRELASLPTVSLYNEALAVGDVDGDSILDAVLCDATDLYIYELLLGTVQTKYGFGCTDLAIGQTDADPQLEIVLTGNPLGGFVLDGESLTVDWADLGGFGIDLCLGDFDGDGSDEVASVDEWGGGIRVQDPETGGLLWEGAAGATVLAAANLDGEPGSELLWAEWTSGGIHVLDGATPVELGTIESPDGGATKIAVGDTDADGISDVLWGAGKYSSSVERLYLARSDSTTPQAHTEDWNGPFFGTAVGDFLGDGSLEVATATAYSDSGYGDAVALVLDFATGALLRAAPPGWGGASLSYIRGVASGQTDADPELEVCFISGDGVGCYDGADFAEQWWVLLPNPGQTLRLGELDGDPFPEVAVGTDEAFVYALEGESGWLNWRTPPVVPAYPGNYVLRFLDVLGDARPEVLASSANGPDTPIRTFDATSGLLATAPWSTDHRSMNPAPAGSPPQELLVGRSNGDIAPFDPVTGATGASIAQFSDPVLAFGFADFNRDGTLDIAALLEDHFVVHNGETGLTLYVSPYIGEVASWADSFQVGDFDGNGVPEIVIATRVGVALFEAPLIVLFADGFESGDTSNW